MLPFLGGEFGNPSSPHALRPARPRRARRGARADRRADRRRAARDRLHQRRHGGATTSRSRAPRGPARRRGHRIVTSAVEHHAVLHALQHLEKFGFEIVELPVDRYGRVDPDQVAAAINERTTSSPIQLANNEVGTLQPIAAIGKVVREKGPRAACSRSTRSPARAVAPDRRRGARARPARARRAQARRPEGRRRAVPAAGARTSCRSSRAGRRSGSGAPARRTSPAPSAWAWRSSSPSPSARRPSSASRKLRDRLKAALLAEDGVELTGPPARAAAEPALGRRRRGATAPRSSSSSTSRASPGRSGPRARRARPSHRTS